MSMSLRKLETEGARKKGVKHGVSAYAKTGQVPRNLPSARAWKRTQARVREMYAAVRQRYGGDNILPDVEVLIAGAQDARLIRELGMLYVKRAGVMRADSLAKGNLEMHSILCAQLVAYSNLERLNLEAAARLAQQKLPEGPAPTIFEIIREHDAAEAEAKAAGAQERKQTDEGNGRAASEIVQPGAAEAEGQADPEGTRATHDGTREPQDQGDAAAAEEG